MSQVTEEPSVEDKAGAFAERLFGAALGATDLLLIDLGQRLELYAPLVGSAALTSGELAQQTGCSERYVREWLEHQASTGILEVDDAGNDADRRRYSLPDAHAEVLLNKDSLAYGGALAKLPVVLGRAVEWVADAFKTGEGVPYERYGAEGVEVQAEFTNAMFKNLLASEWFPAIPEVHSRLQSDPPARVADIACGAGVAAIEIAKAYPKVHVDGFDLDEFSIDLARRAAKEAGVDDRVRFEVRDVADESLAGVYDVISIFEALHDMSNPVGAVRSAKRMLAEGGVLIVADENTGASFAEPGPLDSFYYGVSVLYCLPQSLSEQPSAAIGTVIRAATMESLAKEAGFREMETLPIENDFWRFYRFVL
ncbi:MAG: SAM-dependent methyltransferase [Actinomycetota bacterium]